MRRTFLSTGSPQTRSPENGSERWHVLQNWRQDPVVVMDEASVQRERAHFSPYGRVFGMVDGDTDVTGFDGDYDGTDESTISGWAGASLPYRAYVDIDLDGDVDTTDAGYTASDSMGWDVLSRDGSTIGYAGYVQDDYVATVNHVRYRVLKTDLGRWVQRDPAGYVDGPNLYEYALSSPIQMRDSMGLASEITPGPGGCTTDFGCAGPVLPTPVDPGEGSGPMPDPADCRRSISAIECRACCGKKFKELHHLQLCVAGCNRLIDPNPPLSECFLVPPDAGMGCFGYEDCETYKGANARCFCLCMGYDPWSNFVRACLRCMYDKGVDPDKAHWDCYAEGMRRFPGRTPWIKLVNCARVCWIYQLTHCAIAGE
ncbi:MAG: RHS repeat-associated core domain-containing protein [Phycisphaerales bacterium]